GPVSVPRLGSALSGCVHRTRNLFRPHRRPFHRRGLSGCAPEALRCLAGRGRVAPV
ncbi:MAG: hypothetical protein AVDCRST_MAG68-33, partial [uncultured Gemmatimonadetes bacterium]